MRLLFLIGRYIYVGFYFLFTLRMELQTHLLVCEERQRQCKVNGCHFAGNFKEMEQHNKEQAEKHVSLLTEMGEKLLDVLLKKVRLTEANAP